MERWETEWLEGRREEWEGRRVRSALFEEDKRTVLLGAQSTQGSQTLVQHACVRTVAAADVAAPVEGAVATLGDALRARAVTPATAEQLTPVQRR